MAQSEDTELRDLVIESLEKNGSLAKVRALLRANVFLAFEDECENPKQNESLDKILKIPEGKMSLCIIHEFLEFCNLKNTLFVYTAETRQGKEYNYENVTAEKLNVPKLGNDKEPVLITILKDYTKKCLKLNKIRDSNVKEDENCTYIVNDDTSTTSSQSQSDSSSDEKNKLDLHLTLHTNSDTDTSSDSAKDKSRSEYVPNQQYYPQDLKNEDKPSVVNLRLNTHPNLNNHGNNENSISNDSKLFNNSSTDSTSYMELRPLNALDEVLHNTLGLPDEKEYLAKTFLQPVFSGAQSESISSIKGLSSNSDEQNKETVHQSPNKAFKSKIDEQGKNDTDTMEYSFDFSPQNSEPRNSSDKIESLESIYKSDKKSDQHSSGSHSSVSLSDVADLISEKTNTSLNKSKKDISVKSKESPKSHKQLNQEQVKSVISDDSGDFSESSVPSLSNLSLDIHSD